MVFTCNWMDFLQVYTAILEYVGHPKCILLVKTRPSYTKKFSFGVSPAAWNKRMPIKQKLHVCLCRDTGVRHSVVGTFLWPARQPWTRYQTTCEICHVFLWQFHWDLKTFLFWFYQRTQLIRGFAVMHYINLLLTGWLGSRVVSVLDSGAEGPGFKSQPRCCRVTV